MRVEEIAQAIKMAPEFIILVSKTTLQFCIRVNLMPTFEESLKKLETIVDRLEKGDLALEESLKLFEEGVGLSAACKQELDAAEGKVQMLVKQRDGSLKPEPFLTEKQF